MPPAIPCTADGAALADEIRYNSRLITIEKPSQLNAGTSAAAMMADNIEHVISYWAAMFVARDA
jgi:hypothetical protein